MSTMMRQIMTLFDEYQSRENAKHTLGAMKENARQGFWNGSRPPLGYRIVVAEQRGAKLKKKLEIDPIQAEKIRLIYRLALFGIDGCGPMGLNSIANYLNDQNIRPRRRRQVWDRLDPQDPQSAHLQGRAPLQRQGPQDQDAQAGVRARNLCRAGDCQRGGIPGGSRLPAPVEPSVHEPPGSLRAWFYWVASASAGCVALP